MDWINGALETAGPYWPALTQIAIIWYLGQFFKKRIWTKARAEKGGVFKLMRDTLRLHPLIAGAMWGAAWPWMPAVEFVTTRGGAVTEGMLMGFLTVAGHTALEVLAEKNGWTWLTAVLHDTVPDRETKAPSA